jgi:uncharacterized membrane protein
VGIVSLGLVWIVFQGSLLASPLNTLSLNKMACSFPAPCGEKIIILVMHVQKEVVNIFIFIRGLFHFPSD